MAAFLELVLFFVTFAWFFYRKLYVYGAALFALPIALNWLLGDYPGFLMWILVTGHANPIYVDWALRRIAKANALNLQGEERVDFLRRVGGVSKWAGGVAGIIAALIEVVALVSILSK